MGHHPPPGVPTTEVVSSGLSPMNWFFIIIGILIVIYVIYWFFTREESS